MPLKLYFATVTSSQKIRKEQEKIQMIIEGKKLDHEIVDIASVEGAKDKMRSLMAEQGVEGADKALPPKIFHDDTYCGDYEAFMYAIEDEKLNEFLKLA
mmetsp:Transcript_24835/g.34869  ORF Transcript_24835/g.34869 Transcript_24835/m.34869 type:complete len:99 (+) Transcript_24835:41-337(+)